MNRESGVHSGSLHFMNFPTKHTVDVSERHAFDPIAAFLLGVWIEGACRDNT